VRFLPLQILTNERSTLDKYKLLPNDEDFVFDFNKSEAAFANEQSFPALFGTDTAIGIASFERKYQFTGSIRQPMLTINTSMHHVSCSFSSPRRGTLCRDLRSS
jgi:hypothetical protein